MQEFKNENVKLLFQRYSPTMRERLLNLRELIYQVASESECIGELTETIKWGQVSYCAKNASTIRIDTLKDSTQYYALFFHCQTKLVPTFREIYAGIFNYQGNRAIVFHQNDTPHISELKHCIDLSLTYHLRKHLPLLGI